MGDVDILMHQRETTVDGMWSAFYRYIGLLGVDLTPTTLIVLMDNRSVVNAPGTGQSTAPPPGGREDESAVGKVAAARSTRSGRRTATAPTTPPVTRAAKRKREVAAGVEVKKGQGESACSGPEAGCVFRLSFYSVLLYTVNSGFHYQKTRHKSECRFTIVGSISRNPKSNNFIA